MSNSVQSFTFIGMHESLLSYPVYLNADVSRQVHAALTNSGYSALAQKLEDQVACSHANEHFAAPFSRLSGDDLDLDDAPVIAPGEDGAYVLLWHWVRTADLELASA